MDSNARDRLTEDRERWEVERLERELADNKRVRAQRKSHAITGAITLLICLVFLDLLFQGLATVLNPVHILLNLVFAAVFGLPAGYLISVRRGGIVRGALTAAGVFLVIGFVVGLPGLFWDRTLGSIMGSAVILAICGIIPGAIIGMHVEEDS